MQPRYLPQLNGTPNTGSSKSRSRYLWCLNGYACSNSSRWQCLCRGSCHWFLRAPTTKIFACAAQRCGPGWPCSCNFGRITWLAICMEATSVNLANTLIWDINVWMPHSTRFGWSYVATHASLWLNMRDQFAEEHLEEWEAQKCRMTTLNDLEWDIEVVYRARVIKRQDGKACADSKKAAAEELPPEWRAAHAERQACTTPTKVDVSSTNAGVPLYPNWVVRNKTKPTGRDMPRRYRAPKEDADHGLTLDEELDAVSVFDPLQLASQSSQLDSQHCSMPNSPLGAEGPRTPPHYSDTPAIVPSFDLAQVGILPKMSPGMDQENKLLNLVPGSPITRTAPPGLTQGRSRSEHSSYSGSPMSLGSPTGTASLALALRVCRREPPTEDGEEEMDAAGDDTEDKEDCRPRAWQLHVHLASTPCLAHRWVGLEELVGLALDGQRALLGAPPYPIVAFV